jgi:hypothetical protein
MISSDRFGGSGATAGARVQVSSAAGTESSAVFPAEQQSSRSGKGQLVPHYVPHVYVRGTLEQRVEVRIVRGLGIRAEDGSIDIDVYRRAHIGQATPALALHFSVHTTPPQVLTIPCCLQLPRHRDGTN